VKKLGARVKNQLKPEDMVAMMLSFSGQYITPKSAS